MYSTHQYDSNAVTSHEPFLAAVSLQQVNHHHPPERMQERETRAEATTNCGSKEDKNELSLTNIIYGCVPPSSQADTGLQCSKLLLCDVLLRTCIIVRGISDSLNSCL